MKKLLIAAIVAAAAGGITGCRQKATAEFGEPVFPEEATCQMIALGDDGILQIPNDMVVTDSAVCVLGLADGYWLHAYDKSTGCHLDSAIREGSGPGELVNALAMTANGNGVSVYDPNTQRLASYDAAGNHLAWRDFHEQFPVVWQVREMAGGRILLSAPAMKEGSMLPDRGLYVVDTVGNVLCRYEQIPQGCEDSKLMFISQPQMAVSPDGQHFATATLLGGVLELFSVSPSGEIAAQNVNRYYPVKFETVDGIPQIEPNPTYGFTALAVSDVAVYGAFNGTTDGNAQSHLGVWDWNGNPLKLIETAEHIMRLAVDPTGQRLYAVTHDDEKGFELKYLNL